MACDAASPPLFVASDGCRLILTYDTHADVVSASDHSHIHQQWTLTEGQFTRPVLRLASEYHIAVLNNSTLLTHSFNPDLPTRQYDCASLVLDFAVGPDYVAVLIDSSVMLLSHDDLSLISSHPVSSDAFSLSFTSPSTLAILYQSERNLQLLDLNDGTNTAALSFRSCPVLSRYLHPNMNAVLHGDTLSLWSLQYSACLYTTSVPIDATSLAVSDQLIFIICSSGLHILPFPCVSPGIAGLLGAGPRSRCLAQQSPPYQPFPKDAPDYLKSLKCISPHDPIDIETHLSVISQCLRSADYASIRLLVNRVPHIVPDMFLVDLIKAGQPGLVLTFLSLISINEDHVCALLCIVMQSSDPLQNQIFLMLLALPKTDALIRRKLSEMSADFAADLFSALIKRLQLNPNANDVNVVIGWLSAVIDSHTLSFIEHDRCRSLIETYQACVQKLARASSATASLLAVIDKLMASSSCHRPSANLSDTSRIETISW
jgi:hypothetical protein